MIVDHVFAESGRTVRFIERDDGDGPSRWMSGWWFKADYSYKRYVWTRKGIKGGGQACVRVVTPSYPRIDLWKNELVPLAVCERIFRPWVEDVA